MILTFHHTSGHIPKLPDPTLYVLKNRNGYREHATLYTVLSHLPENMKLLFIV
ncbi:MAG: hypothetical protein BSOLF_2229 [Candidatus Carbobacillus altaicus]|uniref:Uncharacterized protein n=1 Tax=Candidatus Carbonibacillus altaicus TaxID=2163959 RepID=A0A2R6Y337_9BACL|nr:MAG: hypothetical protein BSOLF_2229 [Candidatus Carbobacillus altaicus]